MSFAFEKTPHISLSCTLVPVHTENTNMVYLDFSANKT